MNETTGETSTPVTLVYCNKCKGETRHECCWKGQRGEGDPYPEGGGYFLSHWHYIVWRCLGCLSVTLEEKYNDDSLHDNEGNDIWVATFHPDRQRSKLQRRYFNNLPGSLEQIYRESLIAFNEDAKRLAATGLRGLIEGVCRQQNIEGRNLKKKIDGLAAVLPKNIVENLHSLRFMGNTATHELTPPTTDELRLGIAVCEDLLNFLYELNYKATQLGAMTSRLRPPEKPAAQKDAADTKQTEG